MRSSKERLGKGKGPFPRPLPKSNSNPKTKETNIATGTANGGTSPSRKCFSVREGGQRVLRVGRDSGQRCYSRHRVGKHRCHIGKTHPQLSNVYSRAIIVVSSQEQLSTGGAES